MPSQETESSFSGSLAPLSPELREQLILEHLPRVKQIARRIHERLPVSVALDDLISAGAVGLIDAIDRYGSRSDVKLKTYAEFKIRGAILDSLRRLDWSSRQQRKRAKLIETAISVLEQHHAMPTEEEIAAQLHLSASEYRDWLAGLRESVSGTAEPAEPEGERRNLLFDVADSEEQQSSQILAKTELERLVAEGIGKMPPLEQIVLSRYYYDEMTLSEIANITDLSEVRVAQLRSQAMLRLRSYLSRKHRELTSTETKSPVPTLLGSDKASISRKTSGTHATVSALSNDAREEKAELNELPETGAGQDARALIENPIVQILMAAASAFQELETGRAWLLTPSMSLDNVAPVSLISSQAGREIVANELGLIEHGMF